MAFVAVGQVDLAARLTGASRSASQVLGIPYPEPIPGAAEDLAHVISDLRNALGEEGFEKAHAKGLAMTLDEVVSAALEGASDL